jgi:hypothetical protein
VTLDFKMLSGKHLMNSSPKEANLPCKAIREEELLSEISRPTLLTVEEEALPLDHIQLLAVLFTYLFTCSHPPRSR